MAQAPTLSQWAVGPLGTVPLQDPSLAQDLVCHGTVLDHPEFADGKKILTSRVLELNTKEGTLVTANRVYRLGAICPKYKQWREWYGLSEDIIYKK